MTRKESRRRERSAGEEVIEKKEGAGKGKASVMAERSRGGWPQQRSTTGQWQLGQQASPTLGQQASPTPWRPLGKQPAGLTRPIGPCFACGELGHLRHQCRKAGPSLTPAAPHRSYPCSSILSTSVAVENSGVPIVSSYVQAAESRSIVGEVPSEATEKDWRCVACKGRVQEQEVWR